MIFSLVPPRCEDDAMLEPEPKRAMNTDPQALKRFIDRLPKAEMHIHFEGTFRWATIREFHPDGASLPAAPPWLVEKRFADFSDFRRVFKDFVEPTIGKPEWVERHMFDVLEDLARQNVKYVEMNISLAMYLAHGMPIADVFSALSAGAWRAKETYGIECAVIHGIRRYDKPEVARKAMVEALEVAGPAGTGVIRGVDLQGDERQGPAEAHIDAYRIAKQAGVRLKAHAGELLGAESVVAAVDRLGVDHLQHGVRATDDPGLVAELAQRSVYFHVCPTSNLALQVIPSYAQCHLRALLDAGCKVTINSDDPLLFGVSITDEYRIAAIEIGVSAAELVQMTRWALEAALVPESVKAEWLAELDAVAANAP